MTQSTAVMAALQQHYPQHTFKISACTHITQLHDYSPTTPVSLKTQGDKILDSPLAKVRTADVSMHALRLDCARRSVTRACSPRSSRTCSAPGGTSHTDRRSRCHDPMPCSAHFLVHSLKDIPMLLPEGMHLAAIGQREVCLASHHCHHGVIGCFKDPRDVVLFPPGSAVTRIQDLPSGSVIGTSSQRRIVRGDFDHTSCDHLSTGPAALQFPRTCICRHPGQPWLALRQAL